MKKAYSSVKFLMLSGLIASSVAFMACIPQAIEAPPVDPSNASAHPGEAGNNPSFNGNPVRAGLCDLLKKANPPRSDADVATCKSSTSLSDADKATLCGLDTSGLSGDDKSTLAANGITPANCTPPSPSASPSTPSGATGSGQ